MVQDSSNRVAAVTAVALVIAGVTAYAIRVGPQVTPVEATMDQ